MNGVDLLDVLVSDVLATIPDAAGVFVERRMACPGCPFASFETVREVAATYGMDALELAATLAAVSGATPRRIDP